MKLKRVAAARPPVRSPKPAQCPGTDLLLSVVLPYYKRLHEFQKVFPLNASWLQRKDVEVVVSLDEPSEEAGVVELMKAHPGVQSRVVVNDTDHSWRSPTKAINVGIRHADGDLVMVLSPETAFVGDVPSQMIEACQTVPGGVVVGQVAFASFQEAAELKTAFHGRPRPADQRLFFGVVCFPVNVLYDVRGYDESFQNWGGDDIDVRTRVQMAGHALYTDESVRVIHLSERPRSGMRDVDHIVDSEQLQRAVQPATPDANPTGWGSSFNRIAWDWRTNLRPL
jgi:hypothetical protein